MKLHRVLAAALLLGLSGCGASFDVTVKNATQDSIHVALVDTDPSGDQTPFVEADVAAGTTFSYSMRDGPRSDQKSLRVTSRSGSGSALPIGDAATVSTQVSTLGDRLQLSDPR